MHASNSKGFTLIELILGLVVFAVAMVGVMNVILPQARKGIDPIWQVRAISLAQSLSNEILAKAFDEQGAMSGSLLRCGEGNLCSMSANLGAEAGELRSGFDDVDDYNGLSLQGRNIVNNAGLSGSAAAQQTYTGFSAAVQVFYDDNLDGVNDDDLNQDGVLDTGTLRGNKKTVLIRITTPSGESIDFAHVKANF